MATMTLDQLTAQLRAAYGPALHAVVLYGSAARAGAAEQPDGPADVLVVADTIGMEELRRAAPTIRAWAEAGNPAPLTLTLQEWHSSADVFPMEYADLLAHHRVLAGALPTEGVVVDARDLRRQLEQQALGTLLQLRSEIQGAGNDAKRHLVLLGASRSRMAVLFRSLGRLYEGLGRGGVPAGASPEATAVWAGTTAGFDAAPFVRVIRHAERRATLDARDAAGVLAGYLEAIERLIAHADGLDTSPGASPPRASPQDA